MKYLITGGAGYVGSHMCKYAQENGHEVVILDDLSTSSDKFISNFEFLCVDLKDMKKLKAVMGGRKFDAVFHFAANSLVSESVISPAKYYSNNLIGTINLINVMLEENIKNLIFSSTAAIFGYPESDLIDEHHKKSPINPYGKSKLLIEYILEDISSINKLNVACLRYFNAAGAHKSGLIGEDHQPETHLIPNILNSIISNNNSFKIFGNDYDTHDGTCIRDYIHVNDLARAHQLALDYVIKNKGFHDFNLGNGVGFSILEIIEACKKITNNDIPYQYYSRREGDPSILVSDSSKAINYLGWQPIESSIENIISSAWKWHQNNASANKS